MQNSMAQRWEQFKETLELKQAREKVREIKDKVMENEKFRHVVDRTKENVAELSDKLATTWEKV